jgi:ribosomal protein L30
LFVRRKFLYEIDMSRGVIIVEQTGSPIRCHDRKKRVRPTLLGLRLNRVGRVAWLPNTPQTRGMIARVRHIVRVVIEIKPLSRRRFDALAGYARSPQLVLFAEELEWYASRDERLIGMLLRDRTDSDFVLAILARDERLCFRAIDVDVSLPTLDAAREELFARMKKEYPKPDAAFYQGDAPGRPMDFFTPVVPKERLNPSLKILVTATRYSPARDLIEAMMRFYKDVDGNFVEQFQTTAFNARLWELYLFATFSALGYARVPDLTVPDFKFEGPLGSLGIEATTANPPDKPPKDRDELIAYMENYVPIKLATVLKRKVEKKGWTAPELEGLPYVIAVQDFHTFGAMHIVTAAMTEYVYGRREKLDENGDVIIEWIDEHVWQNRREKSGFFNLPDAENVSAVIVNPQGTLPKFNRLGYLAEFGDKRVRMVRSGLARVKGKPELFDHKVYEAGYDENWAEGMVVLHNPRARIKLSPEMISGASHDYLQPDGRIMSYSPDFHPLLSRTAITVPT